MTLKWLYFVLCIYDFNSVLCLLLNLAYDSLIPSICVHNLSLKEMFMGKNCCSTKQIFFFVCLCMTLISLVPKETSTFAIALFRPLISVSIPYKVVAKAPAPFKVFSESNMRWFHSFTKLLWKIGRFWMYSLL